MKRVISDYHHFPLVSGRARFRERNRLIIPLTRSESRRALSIAFITDIFAPCAPVGKEITGGRTAKGFNVVAHVAGDRPLSCAQMTLIKGGLTPITGARAHTKAGRDGFIRCVPFAGRYLTTLKAAKRFNL